MASVDDRTTGASLEVTRRQALGIMVAGAAGLLMPGLRAATLPRPAGKARSVIQIWMWGGPCHIDTFDPKPEAGYDYCGPLDQTVETNVPGIRINATLPRLAKHADKYAIIRSMTHGSNAHETASYIVQTGREPGRLVFPCAGAVVSLFKGEKRGYDGPVPPYIVLTQPQGRFSEAGLLGQKYKPFATGGDPAREPFTVEGLVLPGVPEERQMSRRRLLESLDALGKVLPAEPQFEKFDRCRQEAYRTMVGEARQIFDLTEEPEEVRDRYGRNTFGQSCLAARRLVERGVPYVTINYKGWDTHKNHFQTMQQKLPELDQGFSALLEDLAERGLLDSTIVWWSGEFGRTPKVMWEPPWNGGRGHWCHCFSAVVAGGGFKGGRVLGASDERGEQAAERPVHPAELLRTVYHLLGIDPDGPLPNERGIETKVLPAPDGSSGLLKELI